MSGGLLASAQRFAQAAAIAARLSADIDADSASGLDAYRRLTDPPTAS